MIFVAQVVSLVEGTPPLTLALLLMILLLSVLYAYKKLTEEAYKVSLRLCELQVVGHGMLKGLSVVARVAIY